MSRRRHRMRERRRAETHLRAEFAAWRRAAAARFWAAEDVLSVATALCAPESAGEVANGR